eukprot:scaffold318237_cov36-Tisochrysis_lutea.AAC.2
MCEGKLSPAKPHLTNYVGAGRVRVTGRDEVARGSGWARRTPVPLSQTTGGLLIAPAPGRRQQVGKG